MGLGFLGESAPYRGCLGPRTLGASAPWLGLGGRSLAINQIARKSGLHRVALNIFLRRDV
jgi:hypothetical protein